MYKVFVNKILSPRNWSEFKRSLLAGFAIVRVNRTQYNTNLKNNCDR
ncbi:hypothetical protein [Dendronalium sp. ChiSLP03b]|nr:hypothetical protein [Dendronalium sp. ChiSLP03b]